MRTAFRDRAVQVLRELSGAIDSLVAATDRALDEGISDADRVNMRATLSAFLEEDLPECEQRKLTAALARLEGKPEGARLQ